MPRYNTSLASASISGSTTIGSPYSGAFTELTGTAPYTVTLPSPALYPGSNQTFYNASSGTITLTTPSGIFTGTGGSGNNVVSCYMGNVVSVTSDGTNYVVISEDGSALVATTGTFSGDVSLSGAGATVSISPNVVTMSPAGSGTINNMSVGATTRSTGAFTTLSANGQTTLSANIASTNTATGSLVITGGLGVSGTINASALSASSITGTLQTSAQPNVTTIGPSGSIFIDASGNTGVNNTNPTKSAKFVVNTQGRLDGGTTQIATGAIVSGPSSSSPSNLFSASTAIFRVHASDQTNNLQFGIGTSAYSYAPWIQGSYDNNSSPGGASAGATNLILQPLGGNVSIGTGVANAKLHIFNRADAGASPGTPEIRIEHQDINAIGTGGSNGGQLNFYNIQRDNTGWSAGKVWGEIGFYPSQPTSGVAQIGAKILAASEGTGGTDTSTYISFQTTGVSTLNERLRIASTGAITAYGNVRIAPTSTSAALYLGSDADSIALLRDNSYDVVLKQDSSSGNGLYLAGAGNVFIGIDSNNNETDRKFIVGNNSTKPTNELFSVNESGLAYASGGVSLGNYYVYNFSGNYSANTWYTLFEWNNLGLDGTVIITGWGDTYAMGGGYYSMNMACPSIVPISTTGTNNGDSFSLGTMIGSGHAPNSERWQLRLAWNYSAGGGTGSGAAGRLSFQWQSTNSYSGASWGTAGKSAQIIVRRLV